MIYYNFMRNILLLLLGIHNYSYFLIYTSVFMTYSVPECFFLGV